MFPPLPPPPRSCLLVQDINVLGRHTFSNKNSSHSQHSCFVPGTRTFYICLVLLFSLCTTTINTTTTAVKYVFGPSGGQIKLSRCRSGYRYRYSTLNFNENNLETPISYYKEYLVPCSITAALVNQALTGRVFHSFFVGDGLNFVSHKLQV